MTVHERNAMRLARIFCLVLIAAMTGCAAAPLPPVRVQVPSRTIGYLEEVKPILDKRCTVCHSCYNSPCQLKLDSFEGADRGATKRAVYNASRLTSMDPTRLFTDAQSTAEWRQKEFFSVTGSTAADGANDSLMIQLLSHKMKNPASEGEYHPEADDLTCSEDGKELGGYLKKHPNRGMPFGFPPLKQQEFDIIAGWLVQGARGPTAAQQAELIAPKASDARAIEQWEAFLNQDDPKHAMTARYLYEHLFLAHVKFGTPTNEFFELVRSKTAPGAAAGADPDRAALRRPRRRARLLPLPEDPLDHRPEDPHGLRPRRRPDAALHGTLHRTGVAAAAAPGRLRQEAERQPLRGLRADPAALALSVPARQRPVHHHDLHPRPGLQGADRPQRDQRPVLGHVPGPGSRPERGEPRLPETAQRQVEDAHRGGQQPAARFGPGRRVPEGGDRLLPRPAGFLRVAQLRRARLRCHLERQPRLGHAGAHRLPPLRQRLGAQGRAGEPAEDPLGARLPPAGTDLLRARRRFRRVRHGGPPAGRPAVHGRPARRGRELLPRFSPGGEAAGDHAVVVHRRRSQEDPLLSGRDAGEDPLRDGRAETRIHGTSGQGAPAARDGDRVRPHQLLAGRERRCRASRRSTRRGRTTCGRSVSSPSPGRRSSR